MGPPTKRTTIAALQAKLDALVDLAAEGNREAFARAFVPLDLTAEDLAGYVEDLLNDETWRNVVAEVAVCAGGVTVTRIDETEKSTTFYFQHPFMSQIDREVVFVCVSGEWRAEG
jgi:hypothetical protein